MSESKYKTWDKVKVSKEFFDLLYTHPLFQQYPKSINTCHYWMNGIQDSVDNNDNQAATWSREDIQERFRPYKVSYTLFRDTLRDLGLITYGPYIPPSQFNKGECRKYEITPLGKSLLTASNKEYLYKLLKDPKVKRSNQKSISKRKVLHKTYDNELLDHLNDLQNHVSFDLDVVEKQLAEETNEDRKNTIRSNLIRITEKRFRELGFNVNSGNRIPNIITNFPKDYKQHLVYRDSYVYSSTLDMRCSHPTFLGELLYKVYQLMLAEVKNPDTTNIPKNRIIDYQVAIETLKSVNPLSLNVECAAWNKLFTNPDVDPRDVIARKLGIDKEILKPLLNQWINGKKTGSTKDGFTKHQIKELDSWFRKEYPELNKVWSIFDRETTGLWITEEYETPIFRNESIYTYSRNELDLIVNDENDGLGIRSRCSDKDLSLKLKQLKDYIYGVSQRIVGFNIPLTTKPVKPL